MGTWYCFSPLTSMDKTSKINFTMQIESDPDLGFLDLKLKTVEGKIRVDVFAKPTNSFSYTTPSTSYPKKNISNIPKDITLRFRRICDDYVTFDKRSLKYKRCLLPSHPQLNSNSLKLEIKQEWKPKQKQDKLSDAKLFPTYNP